MRIEHFVLKKPDALFPVFSPSSSSSHNGSQNSFGAAMKQHKLASRVSVKATQKSNITRSNGNSATAAAASLSVGGNNRGTGSGLSTERLIIEGRVSGLWNPPGWSIVAKNRILALTS